MNQGEKRRAEERRAEETRAEEKRAGELRRLEEHMRGEEPKPKRGGEPTRGPDGRTRANKRVEPRKAEPRI